MPACLFVDLRILCRELVCPLVLMHLLEYSLVLSTILPCASISKLLCCTPQSNTMAMCVCLTVHSFITYIICTLQDRKARRWRVTYQCTESIRLHEVNNADTMNPIQLQKDAELYCYTCNPHCSMSADEYLNGVSSGHCCGAEARECNEGLAPLHVLVPTGLQAFTSSRAVRCRPQPSCGRAASAECCPEGDPCFGVLVVLFPIGSPQPPSAFLTCMEVMCVGCGREVQQPCPGAKIHHSILGLQQQLPP